jgi:hypothetical protein
LLLSGAILTRALHLPRAVSLSRRRARLAADDEFQELCFEFGIELDEVVRTHHFAVALRHRPVRSSPRVPPARPLARPNARPPSARRPTKSR